MDVLACLAERGRPACADVAGHPKPEEPQPSAELASAPGTPIVTGSPPEHLKPR
jgi:hypothetical protein